MLRGGGAARLRADTHRQVPEEPKLLVRVALLLEELVIHGGLGRLFRLLLNLTSAQLRLRRLKGCRLPGKTQVGVIHPALRRHIIDVLGGGLLQRRFLRGLIKPALRSLLLQRSLLRLHGRQIGANAGGSLRAAHSLAVDLLTKGGKSLPLRNVLTEQSLPNVRKLRTGGKVLPKKLLTESRRLL